MVWVGKILSVQRINNPVRLHTSALWYDAIQRLETSPRFDFLTHINVVIK